MTDKNLFEAIITLPSDGTTNLIQGLKTIRNACGESPLLYSSSEGEITYSIALNKLLESDITEEAITTLRNGDWKIKGETLIKILS